MESERSGHARAAAAAAAVIVVAVMFVGIDFVVVASAIDRNRLIPAMNTFSPLSTTACIWLSVPLKGSAVHVSDVTCTRHLSSCIPWSVAGTYGVSQGGAAGAGPGPSAPGGAARRLCRCACSSAKNLFPAGARAGFRQAAC